MGVMWVLKEKESKAWLVDICLVSFINDHNKVGELIMTTNDMHARSDRLKMGRVEVFNKIFPGYVESSNVLDALEDLEDLNDAHKDTRKVDIKHLMIDHSIPFQPLDFLVWTISLWFKEVDRPEGLQSEIKSTKTTQMKVWFAMTIQVIIK